MELKGIIAIIIIIVIIALIPGLYFKNEEQKIQKKIDKEESKETNINQNIYMIQLELNKMRKILNIFLTIIIIPIFIKLYYLIITIDKISQLLEKF